MKEFPSESERLNLTSEPENSTEKTEDAPTSTRKSLQIPRRAFHCASGVIAGLIYQLLLTHKQAVYILGLSASVLYILEQIRINYPKIAYLHLLNKYFLRAEEHLKESAAIPYLMGLLLTIISFPKSISLIAIYTLAISDPLSAIVGIKFGKRSIVDGKSIEGSAAFLVSSFLLVSYLILTSIPGNSAMAVGLVSLFLSLFMTAFEMIPLKLDDNLTIPLATAIILWIISSYVGLNVV